MIADKTAAMQTTGNLTGTDHAMRIDDSAMEHVMSILTDLYSDPALAVVREYSTNAWDAHQEVGNTDPIEVQLPSPLSPFLKIRDYGVGLSEADIENIYCRYGASTKRATNDQVGMLGLGCKSALTYVQQFTVTSTKDGERIQVAVTRTQKGGVMKVVDRRQSDEANGTEVTIPAKKDGTAGGYQGLVSRATEFFSFWPDGSVLVNESKPKRADGLWLTPDILVRKAESYNQDRYGRVTPQHRVVMGNVAYPVENTRLSNIQVSHGYEVIFFVKIGDVNVPPPREGLSYDDKTLATLDALQETFKHEAKAAIQREIDKAKTPWEAIENMLATREALSQSTRYGSYAYKGEDMDFSFAPKGAVLSYPGNFTQAEYRVLWVPRTSYVQNRSSEMQGVKPSGMPKSLWVVGYEGAKFSAPQKQKLLKFIESRTDEIEQFYLLKDHPTEIQGWIDPKMIVKWDDVNAVKLDRKATAYGSVKSIPGSYENTIVDGVSAGEVEADDIDTKKPLYYYRGAWYGASQYSALLMSLKPKGFTLVTLGLNRVEKFRRNFPMAVEVHEAIAALGKEWASKLSKRQRLALSMYDAGDAGMFKKIDAAKVKDPRFAAAQKLARIDISDVLESRKLFYKVLGRIDLLDGTETWKNPLEDYPLFDSYAFQNGHGATYREHAYLYLNAAYAAA